MRLIVLTFLIACGASTEVAEPTLDAAEVATPEVAAEVGDWAVYGDAVADGEVIALATLLDDPAPYEGKTIRVQGRVTDVCQKAGCWMVMADDTRHMRITMKDHAFSVDKQGSGADCIVEGVVMSKDIDPETVAHFKSESSEGAVIPEEAATDKAWSIVASGVKMRKDG